MTSRTRYIRRVRRRIVRLLKKVDTNWCSNAEAEAMGFLKCARYHENEARRLSAHADALFLGMLNVGMFDE